MRSTGLRWSPGFGLTIRGTVAEAVRAPNISELFSPQQPRFFPFQDDPCSIQNINIGSANRAGTAPHSVCLRRCKRLHHSWYSGGHWGNPLLAPEEAETVTAGIVYEPEFVDGLRFIVDYYSTEIEGAIDALSPVRVAEACVDLPSVANNFCPLITRDPKGFITFHQSGQVNLGAFEVEGVDFGIDYGFELGSVGLEGWGAIDLGLNGTKLIDFNEYQDPIDNTVFETRVGEFGYPEWIVNANASWSFKDLVLTWQGRYEESQLLPDYQTSNLRATRSSPIHHNPASLGCMTSTSPIPLARVLTFTEV